MLPVRLVLLIREKKTGYGGGRVARRMAARFESFAQPLMAGILWIQMTRGPSTRVRGAPLSLR